MTALLSIYGCHDDDNIVSHSIVCVGNKFISSLHDITNEIEAYHIYPQADISMCSLAASIYIDRYDLLEAQRYNYPIYEESGSIRLSNIHFPTRKVLYNGHNVREIFSKLIFFSLYHPRQDEWIFIKE